MAELVQLDRAAAMVGKSEVTLRRLIKAGKIPFQKEKTLTGFIYLVDPSKVKSFYKIREGEIVEEAAAMERSDTVSVTSETQEPTSRVASAVRVAVAGESGSAHEYWQKKSELYEERYNQEVVKHSQAREELGVWRGRAEQSQAMLLKLLPSPQEVEVRHTGPQASANAGQGVDAKDGGSAWLWTVVAILGFLLIAAVGATLYLKFVVYP